MTSGLTPFPRTRKHKKHTYPKYIIPHDTRYKLLLLSIDGLLEYHRHKRIRPIGTLTLLTTSLITRGLELLQKCWKAIGICRMLQTGSKDL